MDGSKRQLAVYSGAEVQEYTCGYFASSWSPRLFIAPEEYLSYGIGGVHNITTKPNDPNTSRKEYKIQDHLGNTRVVLDGTGAVIGQYDYKPFGGILWQSAPTPRLSFIDKEKDKETNLSNFGVRNYSDELGRFTSIDPLWEEFRSLTPYHYSENNPVLIKDPDGKFGHIALGAAIGGLIGGGLEIVNQLRAGENMDWQSVGGATLRGAITGGVAAATGGSSLAISVLANSSAEVAGGMVERAMSGEEVLQGDKILTDAAAGGLGGFAANKVTKLMDSPGGDKLKDQVVSTLTKGNTKETAVRAVTVKATAVLAEKSPNMARAGAKATTKVVSNVVQSLGTPTVRVEGRSSSEPQNTVRVSTNRIRLSE